MKRYELTLGDDGQLGMLHRELGTWVIASEASERIKELEAERDEFRYASLERGVHIARLEHQRDEAQKSVAELTAENERLKEALRFYADKKHFTRAGGQYGTPYEVILDEGHIARTALAGGEG